MGVQRLPSPNIQRRKRRISISALTHSTFEKKSVMRVLAPLHTTGLLIPTFAPPSDSTATASPDS